MSGLPVDPARPARKPGFWTGLTALGRAFRFLLHTPASWPAALVPAAVLSLLLSLALYVALGPVRGLIAGDSPGDSLADLGRDVASWAVAVLAGLIGVVIALGLTPVISSPALERLILRHEASRGVPARAPLGFFPELWCGLRAQAAAVVIAGPIVIALWLVEFFFPPAAVVTLPLGFVATSLGLAWNLLDYPLTLRGVRLRERLRFVASHKGATLGFGLGYAALSLVPCCGLLMLPVGAVAASDLLWSILEQEPDALPSIASSARPADAHAIATPS